ncbi:MAG TPA: hypothetical protein VKH15_03260 [Candidatus Acidoferrum sp.]|nr:hypothetical protein [Candidatus Acidoferrum sp.]
MDQTANEEKTQKETELEGAEDFVPLARQEVNSVEALYRAFTDKNPNLLDEALAPDWQDLPLAGQYVVRRQQGRLLRQG